MLTIDRVEIVAMARSWLGTPWIHQGRLKSVGVDCGGLIIGVGKETGLLDFDTQAYSRKSQQLFETSWACVFGWNSSAMFLLSST